MWQLLAQIILLALLVSYLLFKHGRQMRWPVQERQWPGRAIEVRALQSRIRYLRGDYEAVVRARAQQSSSRQKVAASVRQTIQRLTCFRSERSNSPTEVVHEISTGTC